MIPFHSDAVAYIDAILKYAIEEKGSDLHFEPMEEHFRIRMRRDGILETIATEEMQYFPTIVNRFKVLGKMDIAEKRKPQDGGFRQTFDTKIIDFRLSILPAMYGEKIALRILENQHVDYDPYALGYTEKQWSQLKSVADQGQGLLIFTGPTGSGKTTSLYTLLQYLNKESLHIITLEDPVEYRIPGINQIQTNERIGLTFSSGLRSILRQDPQIIMVGEIRDRETAEIAIRAAITGHLVLTTLHTQDALSAIIRLRDMQVEPYLIAAALRGICSQRLVRKLCHCKIRETDQNHQIAQLMSQENDSVLNLYRAGECSDCRSGYQGRTLIAEVCTMNSALRQSILANHDVELLKDALPDFVSMQDDGLQKVMQGITSLEEVFHALHT